MEIKNIEDIEFCDDINGRVQKLYENENFSLRYAVAGLFKKHKHKKTDEVYYVLRGEGFVEVDGDKEDIKAGDIVPIPKGEFHYFESNKRLGPFEMLIVSYPKCNSSDVYLL